MAQINDEHYFRGTGPNFAIDRLAELEHRLNEFERLTKARCEVIENFIGIMPKSSEAHQCILIPSKDGHPYCKICGKYAYSNTYKPIHPPVSEKISINREIAVKWADTMLAENSIPSSAVDLLNEIRKQIQEVK